MTAILLYSSLGPFDTAVAIVGTVGLVLFALFSRHGKRTAQRMTGASLLAFTLALSPYVLCCWETCDNYARYSLEWWFHNCWMW